MQPLCVLDVRASRAPRGPFRLERRLCYRRGREADDLGGGQALQARWGFAGLVNELAGRGSRGGTPRGVRMWLLPRQVLSRLARASPWPLLQLRAWTRHSCLRQLPRIQGAGGRVRPQVASPIRPGAHHGLPVIAGFGASSHACAGLGFPKCTLQGFI